MDCLVSLRHIAAPAFLAAMVLMSSPVSAQPGTAPVKFLSLEELERVALENNPTMAQAAAAVRAAEGRRLQAGLYPNPTVGYQGEEFALRSGLFWQRSEHFLFAQQTFVTGGKLGLNRDIVGREKAQVELASAGQKLRLQNAVRGLYYEALGAARLVEVRRDLARIAREAVDISGQLFNVGQADRPDVLEAESEAERAELEFVAAQSNQQRVWRQLAAVIGNPTLPLTPLAGDLEAEVPVIDEEQLLTALLRDSPDVKIAQTGVERARAALRRARAERIPNIFVRGGFGYSTEPVERDGRAAGPEARIEIGIPLPIFNRNQGNIAAAEAEVDRAERELTRLDLDLRARASSALAAYRNAVSAAERYQRRVLPRTLEAYTLYLNRFRQMTAAYPQVLIAQRSLGQARAAYVEALVNAWQSAVLIRGFLLTGGLDAAGLTPSGPTAPAGAPND